MAATMILPAKNGSRLLSKILHRLARGSSETTKINQKSGINISRLKRRCWYIPDADPAVAAASSAEAPVSIGDLAYRVDTDKVFICSRAPAAATAAAFIQCHA